MREDIRGIVVALVALAAVVLFYGTVILMKLEHVLQKVGN